MSINTNFNVNPYFDDYDGDKKFLRLLFKPGYAVQARELTQVQTLLQNQIQRQGDFVLKNGSLVYGGGIVNATATYLNLSPIYVETNVVANNFIDQTVLSLDESKRGKVIKVYEANEGTGEPITLMIQQVYGSPFVANEVIKTNETTPYYANTTNVGSGIVVSVDTGVYYYEGYYIETDKQTVAVSKYSTATANARVGYEISESIITPSSDTSLLDPAQDASNYQAPGADRFKVDLILSTRSLESIDDERFIQLQEIKEAVVTENYQQTQLSILGEILAQRTYDESGNYTVNPFIVSVEDNVSNSAQTDIIISAGNAYVYGRQFKKTSPTTITIDKPREYINVENKFITMDFGYFLYSNNHFGSFPTNSLQTVDLHCVNVASINTANTAMIANTRIGSARIKQVLYDTASNTSNSSTYEYRTYLFDLAVNDNVVSNVVSTTNLAIGSNVTIHGSLLSPVVDAYRGAKFRISSGLGSSETLKTVTAWNPTTKTLTLDKGFLSVSTPNTASVVSIDFEIGQIKSLINFSSTTKLCSADVAQRSKDPSYTYDTTYISDSNFEPLIMRVGEEYIKQNTISDLTYSYRRLYEGQTFSSGVSPALSVGTGESLASATSTSTILDRFIVTCTSSGGSFTAGQIIPASAISVNTSTRQITVSGGSGMSANIVATIDASNPSIKPKVYYPANTTVQSTGGIDVFSNSAVTLYATQGQVHIANTFINRDADGVNSLFCSDVIGLTKILDFRGSAVTAANAASAIDVTAKYFFDTGQRNSIYDHASIRLKPKYTPPQGPIAVFFNRFFSSGSGFFTVDSYTANNITNFDYGDIPNYIAPTISATTAVYELRDCLDFRPVRSDATAGSGSTVTFDVLPSTFGPKIPSIGTDLILNYSYYLPRIDKVVLDKSKEFQVLTGVSKLDPVLPADTSTGMTLYILTNRPYVADSAKDITKRYINNRRYTMKDIGGLDQRITSLEYYTSLSLLEQNALNKNDLTVRDSENLLRFKNGILVDNFTGTSVVDVLNKDYEVRPKYSIDPMMRELRPSFTTKAHTLQFDSANSSGFDQNGPIVSTSGSEVLLIDQPKASKWVNINPFNVVNYIGKIILNPDSDFWVDTASAPEVNADISGDLDAWRLMAENAADTEWGSWNRVSGSERVTGSFTTADTITVRNDPGAGRRLVTDTTFQATVNVVTGQEVRQGVSTFATMDKVTKSLGNLVVDMSIIPYMRNLNVLFIASDFRPSTTLYPFFDGKPVDKFVTAANRFTLTTNNLQLQTTAANPELVYIKDASNTIYGSGYAVHSANNVLYVANLEAIGSWSFIKTGGGKIVGATTGATYTISNFEHSSSTLTSSGSTTSLTLGLSASGANNTTEFIGKPIFIAFGTGSGQEGTVTAYNVSTRVATVTGLTTAPSTDSIYSIGRPKTDSSGAISGVFCIPSQQFRIGEKLFRLIDNAAGDIPSSRTNGDTSFFSQGLLQTKQSTSIIATTAVGTQSKSVTENRTFTDLQRGADRVVNQTSFWVDPLAETFLISPQQFPQGIFLSKMRFCFKSKDATVPVTLQIRPVVNGYPSGNDVYPYSTVSITPDKVKVTDSPDITDITKYTEFTFPTPLFLQPGEHAFVLIANSNEYEVFAAEIGKRDLVTGRQISEQPYGGSMFMSQNGSTWTADQSSDIQFQMYRKRFNTDTNGQLFFKVVTPEDAQNYDLAQLITQDVRTQNTNIQYSFNSQTLTASYTGYQSIIPQTDYQMTDGYGTRQLIPASGNTTFLLKSLLSTANPDITPFIDTTKIGFLGVNNIVNNLELANDDIQVTSAGTGYSNTSNLVITISGGGGTGATAKGNVANGQITNVEIVDGGEGYTGKPTVTVSDLGSTGSGGVITVTGETDKSGGPADAKYITRRVTLAEGFDSGDLRVYLTAYRPIDTGILVYAKYLSSSDPDAWEDKGWNLLTQVGNANYISTNPYDYRELMFAPGTNQAAENQISYTNSTGSSFNTFKTFAIKIVMTGKQTYDVVKIRDLRVIAMPAKVV
jgi:hypothetical protein